MINFLVGIVFFFGMTSVLVSGEQTPDEPVYPTPIATVPVEVKTVSAEWNIFCQQHGIRVFRSRAIEHETGVHNGDAVVMLLPSRRYTFRTADGFGQYEFTTNAQGLMTLNRGLSTNALG
ncbi:MAG: hypothetical protein FWG05_04560, partial [Kiritimatiellaeota bacterium]|nr:hypothetical protein [Kiritimatiellota bacterium]